MSGGIESFLIRRHVLALLDRMTAEANQAGDAERWDTLREARARVAKLPQMTLDKVPWEMMAHDGSKLGDATGYE